MHEGAAAQATVSYGFLRSRRSGLCLRDSACHSAVDAELSRSGHRVLPKATHGAARVP